jgi:hypothetical protein
MQRFRIARFKLDEPFFHQALYPLVIFMSIAYGIRRFMCEINEQYRPRIPARSSTLGIVFKRREGKRGRRLAGTPDLLQDWCR